MKDPPKKQNKIKLKRHVVTILEIAVLMFSFAHLFGLRSCNDIALASRRINVTNSQNCERCLKYFWIKDK